MTSDATRQPLATALLVTAAVAMAAGVALGAFGAHGLRERVTPDLLAVYETGARYHLVHGLAALIAAIAPIAPAGERARRWAGWLFLVGIVLFSGSLYLLALTGARWLGAITPFGGVTWIAAWLMLAAAGARR